MSITIAVLVTLPAMAQTPMAHSHDKAQHGDMPEHALVASSKDISSRATEPGQGAFAAISELVMMLNADPNTDWSRVNFNALREHLVDMDRLVSDAKVREQSIDDGLRMHIEIAGRQGEAVKRMVPAHATFMSAETQWRSELEQSSKAFVWTVTAQSPVEIAKIRALGFFGIMATGDHHREHHLALVKGAPIH